MRAILCCKATEDASTSRLEGRSKANAASTTKLSKSEETKSNHQSMKHWLLDKYEEIINEEEVVDSKIRQFPSLKKPLKAKKHLSKNAAIEEKKEADVELKKPPRVRGKRRPSKGAADMGANVSEVDGEQTAHKILKGQKRRLLATEAETHGTSAT
ncbi:unnamed protein product [Hydatigera taeniaeformis]|uniref:Uncharacterized protein n=1 Tax=Hydatigena taeniaeformis TaxID=6205 RepID=A0A0R3WSL3_HYDTA|nr:unnamed protein product [Hydatigera taeniaeformis]